MVWVAGGALAAVLLGALTLLAVVLYNGLGVFWPARVERCSSPTARTSWAGGWKASSDPQRGAAGPLQDGQSRVRPRAARFSLGHGKRRCRDASIPRHAVVLERLENGDFYGVLQDLKTPGLGSSGKRRPGRELQQALRAIAVQRAEKLDPLLEQIAAVTEQRAERLRLAQTQGSLSQAAGRSPQTAAMRTAIALLEAELKEVGRRGRRAASRKRAARRRSHGSWKRSLRQNVAVFQRQPGDRSGRSPLIDIVRAYHPNAMGLPAQSRALPGEGLGVALHAAPRVEHGRRRASGNLRHGDADHPDGPVQLSPGSAGRRLSRRICPGRRARPPGADRREQPGRHPLDRLRHLRGAVSSSIILGWHIDHSLVSPTNFPRDRSSAPAACCGPR